MRRPKKKADAVEPENLATPNSPVVPAHGPEISQDSKLERLQLPDLLFQKADDLARADFERKKQKDQEVIELLGGHTTSRAQEKALIAAKRQPYKPRFPRDNKFFSEIFRTNGWIDLDPHEFQKPAVVAVWIIELIYNRFSQEVLSTIRVLNHRKAGGWAYKHFQYLSAAGIAELIQYRDEAVEVLETCSTFHEFRVKMLKLYGVPYQGNLFLQ